MKTLLFLSATVCLFASAHSGKVVWSLPLDKAKVLYHHQKVCLNVKGVENCINKDKEPGDPEELAKMFSIVHEYESEAGEEIMPDDAPPEDSIGALDAAAQAAEGEAAEEAAQAAEAAEGFESQPEGRRRYYYLYKK